MELYQLTLNCQKKGVFNGIIKINVQFKRKKSILFLIISGGMLFVENQEADFRGPIRRSDTLPGFQGRTTINHPEDERGETQGERKRKRVKQQ